MLTIGDFARLGQVSPRMLRHYDDIGLLRPDHVDSGSGYRSYAVRQLGDLHRILALRGLGFSLEQIGVVLREDPSIDQLRGMLRMRQAQIEHSVVEELDQLRRVDAHLRAIEGKNAMELHDVVMKTTTPLRIAEAKGSAPGFGQENLGPLFGRLVPEVLGHLGQQGARPGILVGYYEEPDNDGCVVLHAGFVIDDQAVDDGDAVSVVELPSVEVASVVHHGSMEYVVPVYESLVQWIEDSGYRLAGRSRELYHEFDGNDLSRNVTELQMPIAR